MSRSTAVLAASFALWFALPAGAEPPHHGHGAGGHAVSADARPVQPGQAVFGAVQEIVALLEADPATDWSRVDIDRLHRHLLDMERLATAARAVREEVPGGLRLTVTGEGKAGEAARRMIPAHAGLLAAETGWAVRAEPLPAGAVLTVTSGDPAQAARIRALGFMGLMARGGHHQPHHLAMARGGGH